MKHDSQNGTRLNDFLDAAEKYCAYCDVVLPDREEWCRELLTSLVALYRSALLVPVMEALDDDADIKPPIDVSNEEWRAVYSRLQTAFGIRQFYWSIPPSNGFKEQPPEPVCGDLADDLADIYREVCPTVRAFRWHNGAAVRSALFDCITVGLASHWGMHAVDAMRELHSIVFVDGLDDGSAQDPH